MKVYKDSAGIAPLILNLGDRWRLVVNINIRPEPRRPLNGRLGGPKSRSGRFGKKKKKSVAPAGIRIPDRPARSIVAIPTTQSRLRNATEIQSLNVKLFKFQSTKPYLFLETEI